MISIKNTKILNYRVPFQFLVLFFFVLVVNQIKSELLHCESTLPGLPHCSVQLTRKVYQNGTTAIGLESCRQLTNSTLIVTISQLVQNVSFVCVSKHVLETKISFEYGAPIVHYTNVRRRRKSYSQSQSAEVHFNSEHDHELNISIPTTPRILGLSKRTTLVRYGVYNLRNVTNPSAHVNVLFYVLQYSWNMTYNHKVHWMKESTIILANEEIVLIPCLSVTQNISVFRLSKIETEGSPLINKNIHSLDPESLTYDPVHGFWMNTTKVNDFNGQYLCSSLDFENTLTLINSEDELQKMITTQNIIQFSIEYAPEIQFDPTDQLLLADDQYTTDKLYNLQMKGEPFTLSCSSVKNKVAINVVEYVKWSGNLNIDIKSYQVTKPENRSYSVATISHVGQEACIRTKNGQECLHDVLRFECATGNDTKPIQLWEIRTKQLYTDEEYEDYQIYSLLYDKYEKAFVCYTSEDNSFQHSGCESAFQCQILANCLHVVNRTGICISSATSLAKSTCESWKIDSPNFEDQLEAGREGRMTCNVAKPLPTLKGILQCTTLTKLQKIDLFRVKYFVGFDGMMYGDTRTAPLNAILKLKEYYQDDIYYTLGKFRFRCQAQSFFYEDGIVWFEQFKNGSLRLVPNDRITAIPPGHDDDENPESLVEILFEDDTVEKIVCAAPKLYTEKAWGHISINVTVGASILPVIASDEGTIKSFRVGDSDQSLTCHAGGFPRPDISWTFNDKELDEEDEDPNFQIVDKVISKVLVFRKYDAGLAGEYKCTATNILGNTSQVFQVDSLVEQESSSQILFYTIPSVAFVLLLLTSLWTIFVYRRKAEREKYREIKDIMRLLKGDETKKDDCTVDAEGFDPLWSSYDESQEMDKVSFFVDRTALLGKGEFGEVYKGRLDGVDGHVAFKTPARNAPMPNLRMLVSELKIIMYIGPHENIVALLGAYTKEIKHGILYVATEYCGLGNLETYLRSYKHLFIKGLTFAPDESEISRTSGIHKYEQLCAWCGQIANAMEYLNSKKVIHSDLATRNVLLTADAIAKVTDFGLSRRTYKYTEYVKKGSEPLPWQWLSPEAIRTHTFSVETDIWAYGITLWEIFSFGDVPYCELGYTTEFVQQLESGMRSPKPKHATNEIYEIMVRCWDLDVKQRPNFAVLRESFEKILHNWHYVSAEITESQNPAITRLATGYVEVASIDD